MARVCVKQGGESHSILARRTNATKRSELSEIMHPDRFGQRCAVSTKGLGEQTCLPEGSPAQLHSDAWLRLFLGTAEKLRSIRS